MRRSLVAAGTVVVLVLLMGGAALAAGVGRSASAASAHRSRASGVEPNRLGSRSRGLLDADMRARPARRTPRSQASSAWITSPGWPASQPAGHYANGSAAAAAAASRHAPRVLRVGTYHGIRGQYRTIQAAVDAAKPYDVILIGPGDYKTHSYRVPRGSHGRFPAAVLITTPNLTIRGMNRNSVIVDDTTRGPACNNIAADQDPGPMTADGPAGLNGMMVFKADNVTIENLTACNFPGGAGGGTGNEIWWNGGADSGTIGGWGYYGAYLTGTTLFYNNEKTAAQYGIFSSNWNGGMWNHVYASNMNDSGLYIGACQQQCNQVVNDAWSQFSALGYSGTNSGGSLVIENSQWDHNEDGFDTNSQNADEPAPQDGACPGGGISPITHTHSCWVFMDNYSHDNNNANAPAAGSAAAGPVGTGMTLSGGRNDTVMNNTFANNDAWGNAFVPYPDSGPPCSGGTGGQQPGAPCIFDEYGDALIGNHYNDNGSYHNPTNGDFGFVNLEPNEPTDCFANNTDAAGTWTSTPSGLEQQFPTCNGQNVAAPSTSNPQADTFLAEIACDSGAQVVAGQSTPCPPGSHYPTIGAPIIHPLPAASDLVTMPNPCADVPSNPWCRTPRRESASPTTRIATKSMTSRLLKLSGFATAHDHHRITRVGVAVARAFTRGGVVRCAFLTGAHRWSKAGSCAPHDYLRATGTRRWQFVLRSRFERGVYYVWEHAIDNHRLMTRNVAGRHVFFRIR